MRARARERERENRGQWKRKRCDVADRDGGSPDKWIERILPRDDPWAGARGRLAGGRSEEREEGGEEEDAVRAYRTSCRAEINGALITLIEALRRIDTTPIGPVSFRDTDRSYDK